MSTPPVRTLSWPRISSGRARASALSALGLVLLLGIWTGVDRAGWFKDTMPSPMAVVRFLAAKENRKLFLTAIVATLRPAAAGALMGAVVAMGAAALTQVLSPLREGTDRLFALVNALPLVALGPLFVVTVGPDGTPTAVAALAVAFTLYVATSAGLRAERQAMADVMAVLGGSKVAELRLIRIPAALPVIADGLTLAAPGALLGALLGQWFGASAGLGVVIVSAMQNFQIELLWSAAIISAVLSLVVYAVLRMLERLVSRRFA